MTSSRTQLRGATRLARVTRGDPVSIRVNGQQVLAFLGETVGAALLADGRRTIRFSRLGTPRGIYCGIGLCHECLVTVDGQYNVRACQQAVGEGMVVVMDGLDADSRRQ